MQKTEWMKKQNALTNICLVSIPELEKGNVEGGNI